MDVFCGGKGFNQAIALSRAGEKVSFAGLIGKDGTFLLDSLKSEGIDTALVDKINTPSGHAVIQVDTEGQNCILVVSGANGCVSKEYINLVLSKFTAGDIIVLQNEISNIEYVIEKAHAIGMKNFFNPSPCDFKIGSCNLDYVDFLLINETEGEFLTGENRPEKIIEQLKNAYTKLCILLTLGERGSVFCDKDGEIYSCDIYKTAAIDTTAAGDTFTGYFIAAIMGGKTIDEALREAAIASGIAVSRMGASNSIPYLAEVAEVKRQLEPV